MTLIESTRYENADTLRQDFLSVFLNEEIGSPSNLMVRRRVGTSDTRRHPIALETGREWTWTFFSPETRVSTSFPEFPESRRFVLIHFSLPVLTEQLKEEFNEIRNLPPGWDGYDAGPIEEGPIAEGEKVVRIGLSEGLSDPWVAPGSDGSVGITWDTEKGDIYIDILPNQPPTYALDLFNEDEDREETEGDIKHDLHLRYILRLLVD